MKRIIVLLSIFMCMSFGLVGCSNAENKSHAGNVSEKSENAKVSEEKESEAEETEQSKEAEETEQSKEAESDTETQEIGEETMSGKDIFTEEIFETVTSIEYMYGSETLVVTKEEDIKKIYDMLAGLELTEYKLTVDTIKGGYSMFDIVTTGEAITVGLLGEDMVVDGRCYTINENIVEEAREIALKYLPEQ